jgi:eukaryotic-like serine/threonine-protein kinase
MRRAQAALSAPETIEDGEALVGLCAAEVLDATGDHPGAVEAIDAAHRRLLAHAARIGDDAWRTSFLERVPENARTIDLARRWGASPRDA